MPTLKSGGDIIANVLRRCGGETAELTRLATVAASMYKIEWSLARRSEDPAVPTALRPNRLFLPRTRL